MTEWHIHLWTLPSICSWGSADQPGKVGVRVLQQEAEILLCKVHGWLGTCQWGLSIDLYVKYFCSQSFIYCHTISCRLLATEWEGRNTPTSPISGVHISLKSLYLFSFWRCIGKCASITGCYPQRIADGGGTELVIYPVTYLVLFPPPISFFSCLLSLSLINSSKQWEHSADALFPQLLWVLYPRSSLGYGKGKKRKMCTKTHLAWDFVLIIHYLLPVTCLCVWYVLLSKHKMLCGSPANSFSQPTIHTVLRIWSTKQDIMLREA